MRKPDFFIVGAPKCGTTAMARYLAQSPDIFMPRMKEINFFGRDLEFSFPRIGEQQYLSLFSDSGEKKRAGEASVWYLYSRLAASEIKEFNPSARIIIMLRNPMDMMYALYCQRLYNGNEDIQNFGSALGAEPLRRQGMTIPKNATNVMGCCYRESASFTKQVRRYLDVFGGENVHVIIFDDFVSATSKIYREICRFPDVNEDFAPDFKIINQRKGMRSKFLRDLLRKPPPAVEKLFKVLMLRRTARGGYAGWLKRLNSVSGRVPPMDPNVRRRLQEEFRPEIEALSSLLGRDLTHWSSA